MRKILTVLGARPQFIKASVVSDAMIRCGGLREIVVHTGQHFDANMSDVFFAELGMAPPAHHLGIHGGMIPLKLNPMTPQQVADLILAGLPGATVDVQSEDDVHFAALVVSPQFAGLRPIARHQLVYKTLGELMGREIHAMSLETLTPDELASKSR